MDVGTWTRITCSAVPYLLNILHRFCARFRDVCWSRVEALASPGPAAGATRGRACAPLSPVAHKVFIYTRSKQHNDTSRKEIREDNLSHNSWLCMISDELSLVSAHRDHKLPTLYYNVKMAVATDSYVVGNVIYFPSNYLCIYVYMYVCMYVCMYV